MIVAFVKITMWKEQTPAVTFLSAILPESFMDPLAISIHKPANTIGTAGNHGYKTRVVSWIPLGINDRLVDNGNVVFVVF